MLGAKPWAGSEEVSPEQLISIIRAAKQAVKDKA